MVTSTSTSPSAFTVRSKLPCWPNAVSMWSKKAMPVEMSVTPVPSRFNSTVIDDCGGVFDARDARFTGGGH